MSSSTRSIPSLDGLRAFAIGLVVLAHMAPQVPYAMLGGKNLVGPWGQLGVAVFFVISGFLITRLLMREIDASGRISLGRFYSRRALRIFPALYVYLAVVAGLWFWGTAVEHAGSFLAAATYTWNYYAHASGPLLGHLWSLSLEEQFYLIWPVTLALCGSERARRLAIAAVLAAPFLRLGSYFVLPSLRDQIGMMLHTRLDTILYGALLALYWNHAGMKKAQRWLFRPWVLGSMVLYLLVADCILTMRFRGFYLIPIGYSVEAIFITTLVAYAIQEPDAWAGRILNSRPLQHVGVISYSLYIWQQLFFYGDWPPHTHVLPWDVVLAFCAAEASFHWVERPILRWRDRNFRAMGTLAAGRAAVGASGG